MEEKPLPGDGSRHVERRFTAGRALEIVVPVAGAVVALGSFSTPVMAQGVGAVSRMPDWHGAWTAA